MFRRTAAVAAALILSVPVAAQEGQPVPKEPRPAPAVTLNPGDKAPALAIEKWIKGEPVTGFEKGNVYVLEFWATWCGPCIRAMPHLSLLQKEYKDKGVTIIAVDIAEKYHAKTVAHVENFVKSQGDRMALTVAYDGPGKATATAYMNAAGRDSIPTSFIIDRDGVIAYIGAPGDLDMALPEVVAGTWDTRTGPEKIKRAHAAFAQAARLMQEDGAAGLAAWQKAERDYPLAARGQREYKWQALVEAGLYDEADAIFAERIDEAIAAGDGKELNELAWMIVDPEGQIQKKNLDLAMKAALKADELTGHKDWATLDTLALVYYLKGDAHKALELQQRAFDLAPEQRKPEVTGRLEQFRKAAGKG